jgi:hypothetical protein
MWNLISNRLEIMLASVQDRCMVCAKRTIGSEIVLTHPMVLLGYEAQVDACFGSFVDSANLDARYVHGLHRTYHMLRNRCWTHPMDPLGDVGLMECCFSPFGDSVSLSAR